jgi:hypothetical protein
MLRLYVPVAVTFLLIATLTWWESEYSDRFTSSSVTAEEFGKRFANLPATVGPWEGVDHKVDEKTLDVAGAVNHVSRTYTNTETGDTVDLWLVVGHSRDIGRHTPDVCYVSQGFSQDGTKQKHKIEVEGEAPATFYTARFRREDQAGVPTRVFWAWNANDKDSKEDGGQDWIAPDNQRLHFGNNTALYKMYFTARMPDRDQPVADNVSMEFAKVMLPAVNRALFPDRYLGQATAGPAATDSGAKPPATAEAEKDPTLTAPADAPVPGAGASAKPEAEAAPAK